MFYYSKNRTTKEIIQCILTIFYHLMENLGL